MASGAGRISEKTKCTIGFVRLVCLVLGGVSLFVWRHGRYAQIRSDTGDLRFCIVGVPYKHILQPASVREPLLRAARMDPPMASEWLTCGDFPDDGYWICYEDYRVAALWVAVDPRIARLVMEDVANWIRRTGARSGVSEGAAISQGVLTRSPEGSDAIAPDWAKDLFVQEYLQSKGYKLPPASQ